MNDGDGNGARSIFKAEGIVKRFGGIRAVDGATVTAGLLRMRRVFQALW